MRVIFRRMRSSALPLLVVVIGVFVLARLTGDPSSLYLPLSATEDMRQAFREKNGLDQPVLVQLWNYLLDVSRFDFGESLITGRPAGEMALEAFPATLQLAAISLFLALFGAVLFGSLAALKPNSIIDRFANLTSLVGASMPDFWFAIVGILFFSINLGWLPTSGQGGILFWLLPVATLTLRPLGVLTQVVRASMSAILSEPYIKLARSKGVSQTRLVLGHALRNVSVAVLTVAGDLAVGLINGAVVVETIFGWPGIGKLMIGAILGRDFATLQAAVMLTAFAIFLLNFLIDLAYWALDPRVRSTNGPSRRKSLFSLGKNVFLAYSNPLRKKRT